MNTWMFASQFAADRREERIAAAEGYRLARLARKARACRRGGDRGEAVASAESTVAARYGRVLA